MSTYLQINDPTGRTRKSVPEYVFRKNKRFINFDQKIKSSKDIHEFLSRMVELYKLDLGFIEYAFAVYLNRAMNVKGFVLLSQGGIAGTLMEPIMVLKPAVEYASSSVIIAHNHPTGTLNPSETDKRITEKIKQGALYLDMSLTDHIILEPDLKEYYSFADNDLI